MAIGRTFQESFKKALRGLEIGVDGLVPLSEDKDEIIRELRQPGPNRIWYVADAMRIGIDLETIFQN